MSYLSDSITSSRIQDVNIYRVKIRGDFQFGRATCARVLFSCENTKYAFYGRNDLMIQLTLACLFIASEYFLSGFNAVIKCVVPKTQGRYAQYCSCVVFIMLMTSFACSSR